MTASPEQYHEILMHCINFANTMLTNSGDFYPFGAYIANNGKLTSFAGYIGDDHPSPVEMYKVLQSICDDMAKNKSAMAIGIAVNVNIPNEYNPVSKDGIRVHLEGLGFSRFIYIPYELDEKRKVTLYEPFSVQINPNYYK